MVDVLFLIFAVFATSFLTLLYVLSRQGFSNLKWFDAFVAILGIPVAICLALALLNSLARIVF